MEKELLSEERTAGILIINSSLYYFDFYPVVSSSSKIIKLQSSSMELRTKYLLYILKISSGPEAPPLLKFYFPSGVALESCSLLILCSLNSTLSLFANIVSSKK